MGDPDAPHPAVDAPTVGVLLANLGSPAEPSPAALRTYLRQFLADPRVVDAPRLKWWLLRNLIIVPLRAPRSARLYRKIWTPQGSPLLVTTYRQAEALEQRLSQRLERAMPVAVGMRYGEPGIGAGLRMLRDAGCGRIVMLPLFPQYSGTTTASSGDAAAREIRTWHQLPDLRMVSGYHDHPTYIRALVNSVREAWSVDGEPERLLVSFHGLPQRYADAGDPYPQHCAETARLLASELDAEPDRWRMSFQSRFGREPWLEPFTDVQLRTWAEEGIRTVDVICPGFAADCLETLEEIAVASRQLFESAGGQHLRYIAALNDRPDHVEALSEIVINTMQGWL
jgi:ferrochelatase